VRRVILVLILAFASEMDDRDFMKTNRYAQSHPNHWLFDKWLRGARRTGEAAQWPTDGTMGKVRQRGANLTY
jgi:hypothetical protein